MTFAHIARDVENGLEIRVLPLAGGKFGVSLLNVESGEVFPSLIIKPDLAAAVAYADSIAAGKVPANG